MRYVWRQQIMNAIHARNIHAGTEEGLKIRRGWVSDNQGLLKEKILLLYQNLGFPSPPVDLYLISEKSIWKNQV